MGEEPGLSPTYPSERLNHSIYTGCTAKLGKVIYVSMKEYGYSALTGDYVYLEDVGRKVKGVGKGYW